MSRFSTQFHGTHVMVTGGTKGIGRGIVEAFLAEGANVSYCARSVQGDEFASFKDVVAGTARAVGTAVDIHDPSSLERWVDAAAEEFGRIDFIVANAASASFTAGSTLEGWQQGFQGTILGLISLIERALPHLKTQPGKASIIVMGSVAVLEAGHRPGATPYATLKRALMALAKDYSRKLGPLGVRINTIAPGAIETPGRTLPGGTYEPSSFEAAIPRDSPYYKRIVQSVPLGRTGTVEEVANAALFLASPLSSYTTGSTLFVDGGVSVTL